MRELRFNILLVLILSSAIGFGQLEPMSLVDAQDYAMENNAQVRSSLLDVKQADKDVSSILRGGLPQINGELSYQNYIAIPTQLIPAEFMGGNEGEFVPLQFGTKQNLNSGVTVNQLIFDGSYFIGVKAASKYRELSKSEYRLTKIETKVKVAQAYYGVLIADENRRLLGSNQATLKKLYEEAVQLYKNGFIESIEVDRLQISLNNIENAVLAAERAQDLARYSLNFTLGLSMDANIQLTDDLESLRKSGSNLIDAEADLSNRVDFSILKNQKELLNLNVRRLQTGYLPKLYFFGNYSQVAQGNKINFSDESLSWFESSFYGFTLSVPIFDAGKKAADIQKEKLKYEQVLIAQRNMEKGIKLEVEQSRIDFMNATENLSSSEKNLALAKRIYDVTVIKYKEGVGSSVELNNAESTWLESQNKYISALYNLLIKRTNFEKALGEID